MKPQDMLLRVFLTLLLVFAALLAGITLVPRLTERLQAAGRGPGTGYAGLPAPLSGQPDWGGGHLSSQTEPLSRVIDSVTAAFGGDSSTRTYSSPSVGVVLRQKSATDYSLALALPVPARLAGSALFEVPSTNHFRKQLFPGQEDTQSPAADIPLYPKADCRTQVGHGTACFIGFYLTPDSIEAVHSFYIRALYQLGWKRLAGNREPGTAPVAPASSSHQFLEVFTKRKGDRMVVVQLKRQDSLMTRIGLVATTGSPGPGERR